VKDVLREIVRAYRRRWLAAQIRTGNIPVPTPQEVERLRAPRLPAGALDWLLDQ